MHPLSPACVPSTHTRHFYVSIQPPVGELMAPVFMSENEFRKEQGEWGPGPGWGATHCPHGGTHCMLCPPATRAVAQSTSRGRARVSGSSAGPRVAPLVPFRAPGCPNGVWGRWDTPMSRPAPQCHGAARGPQTSAQHRNLMSPCGK